MKDILKVVNIYFWAVTYQQRGYCTLYSGSYLLGAYMVVGIT